MEMQSKLVKRYKTQLAEAKQFREDEITAIKADCKERLQLFQQKYVELESKLKKQTDANSLRAVRSSSAYCSRIATPNTSGGLSKVALVSSETHGASCIPSPKGKSVIDRSTQSIN